MLAITPDAADMIGKAIQESEGAGVRISARPQRQNGKGPALSVDLVPAPEAGDQVVEAGSARLFVEPTAAPALDEKVLDVQVDAGEIRLALLEQGEP